MVYKGHDKFMEQVKSLKNTTVIYDNNNIVVLEVKSFDDCNKLFDKEGIHWCIAQSEGHWNDYVGCLSHQYFIVDFNKLKKGQTSDDDNNNSLIGFTFTKGELSAAHARNDKSLRGSVYDKHGNYEGIEFEKILKEKGIYNVVYSKANTGANEVAFTIFAIIIAVVFAIWGITKCSSKKNESEPPKTESKVSLPKTNKIILIGVKENTYTDKIKLDSLTYYGWGGEMI